MSENSRQGDWLSLYPVLFVQVPLKSQAVFAFFFFFFFWGGGGNWEMKESHRTEVVAELKSKSKQN